MGLCSGASAVSDGETREGGRKMVSFDQREKTRQGGLESSCRHELRTDVFFVFREILPVHLDAFRVALRL